jgi:hypothetical protein
MIQDKTNLHPDKFKIQATAGVCHERRFPAVHVSLLMVKGLRYIYSYAYYFTMLGLA